ncbi:MAG: fructosamine kinase family protein [Phycisphaerales bacterium JB037]
MDDARLIEQLGTILDEPVRGLSRLSGGCVADVRMAELAGGGRVVVKAGAAGSKLDLEGWMLGVLRERSSLPVPGVLHASDELLVIEHIEHDGIGGATGEAHAAELLAEVHSIEPACGRYGLERDTLIGPLDQPNGWMDDWAAFFADRRLRAMGAEAERAGRIDAALARRVEAAADRAAEIIGEPGRAGLIHGDVWSGNVLFDRGRVAGLIDPSVYYADPEIELAFIALFSTFGERFFARYAERRNIRAGFFERRCGFYNLYPLLVHARLFGGSYPGAVARTLSGLGL